MVNNTNYNNHHRLLVPPTYHIIPHYYQPAMESDKSDIVAHLGDCKEEKYAATILRGFEILYAVWFTMEILLRFLFCPKKGDFIKTISNWVDLIAVIPVYLLLILPALPGLMMLNMIRYVRIFRFFKLLYDLQILGKTLQAGMHQIFISFLILTVPTIIFSSLVYYTEHYLGSEKSKGDFREIQKGNSYTLSPLLRRTFSLNNKQGNVYSGYKSRSTFRRVSFFDDGYLQT